MSLLVHGSTVRGLRITTANLAYYIDAANLNSYDRLSNTFIDLTNGVVNVSLLKTPTFSSEVNGIVTFDGTANYGVMSKANVTVNPNNIWTLNMWIKPQYQLNTIINPTSFDGIQSISYDSTGAIRIVICDTLKANIRNRLSTAGSVPQNKWTNVCISINSTIINIYINGVLNSTFNESKAIAPWDNGWVLFSNNLLTQYYMGGFSNLSLYDRILNQQEILQNYIALKSRFNS
jgi:hypothetical protein